jgi:hypothetical protein
MKKLLILLAALGFGTAANANDAPTGDYEGYITITSPAHPGQFNGSGTSTPQLISVHITDRLPDLGDTGVITANILFNQKDCFGGVGNLHLDHLGLNIPVTATDCQINGNTITGNYVATKLILTYKGMFSFTRKS